MKTCFKCGETKPLTEYYRHRMMQDEHLNKCKACTKLDVQANTAKLMQDAAWIEKELEQQRIKQRKLSPVISREKKREYNQRHHNKHPERVTARTVIGHAIRDGRLIRKPCEVCGDENSEGHHEDYLKPLDVIWYCPKHHAERHVEIRKANRRAALKSA